MTARIRDAVIELFKRAPRWRYALFGTTGLTLLAAIFPPSCDSGPPRGGSPQAVTTLRDPVSDQRLQDFTTAAAALTNEARAGYRCEKLLDALKPIQPNDRNRAAQKSSSQATAAQPALAAADACRSEIGASDDRFADLSRAVAKAATDHSAQATEAVASAIKALNGYDRSRDRFASETALVAKARSVADAFDASTARMDALARAAQRLADDKSPQAYLALAESFGQITGFDRERLTTPAQQEILASANEALRKVQDGRQRIAQLVEAVATRATDPNAVPLEKLLNATARIHAFEEALATPQQVQAIRSARQSVTPMAWSLLQDRLRDLASQPSPDHYDGAIRLYEILKSDPGGQELTDDQKSLLAQGRAAAELIAASDARLAGLAAAAQKWRQRTGNGDPGVIAALQAITPLDQVRFQAPDRTAWEILTRAEAIIRGPELGLNAASKGRVPIFVYPAAQGKFDRDVTEAVRSELQRSGFVVTGNGNDAALAVGIGVDAVDDPTMDTSGAIATYNTTARVSVHAVWLLNQVPLFGYTLEEPGKSSDRSEAQRSALRAAVAAITQKFTNLTKN